MDWKVLAALGVMVVALAAWLAISIVTSVNRYARRFTEEPEDKRRGFEVKPLRTETDDGEGSDQHH
jgi:hypothetical protein